ncbi:hypothetical protein BESB_064320 [Besnoitia besnoiti]|uniref:Heme-copper oxidase subunit III family profile domain-containing protein n=1 Tax=Besnoitia besnoiti TaxID=94643 RepID=A0A2A9M5G2_BESBE|nr:uncharacterized protein BESB_064320 [Besnoitia besnoiti]PFH30883.1 hypothetical protein BESB_064320 [Besnoitia besnoiti]
MTFTLVVAFLMLVCTEYLGLSLYINDNAFGNGLFILTGIHFSHVIVGAILVFFTQSIYSSLVTYMPTSSIMLSKSKAVLSSPVGVVVYCNHKELGCLYLITGVIFSILGTIMSLFIRFE